ncbi:CHRD domain-containing protein [Streptomyces sp. NPDC090798]|uniref:CHRD domain-containing protein n=1 Tax=Streptomyces sp. NPDC090798 TaxID=3365968 RepID=UPI00382269F1
MSTATRRATFAVITIATALAATACSSSSSPSASSSAPASASPLAADSASPSASKSAFSSAKVAVKAQPVGTVRLGLPGGKVSAAFDITGLAPGIKHAVDIVPGSCAQPRSDSALVSFPTVTDDDFGNLKTTVQSTQSGLRALPGNAVLVVRLSDGDSRQQKEPIACVPLPSGVPDGSPVKVQPAGSTKREGDATVAYDAATKTYTVKVKATGLAANSRHAAHLHQGTCTKQGPVLVMLGDLTADDQGVIDMTVKVPDQSAQLTGATYLNIHLGDGSQILSKDKKPTPLFQPLLCGPVTT